MEKCPEYEMYLVKLGEKWHEFQVHMSSETWVMMFFLKRVKTGDILFNDLFENRNGWFFENGLSEKC